jgi:excisionase family DNA binding protein
MSSGREHLSVSEVAGELGVSESLVRNLIGRGQLTAYRYGPRKTVVYGEDLKEFKQSRRVKTPNTKETS